MKTIELEFEGSLDHKLSASLDMPDGEKPDAYAVFAHCFTCSKRIKAVVNACKEMTEHNLAVLRFDFTGLGESKGKFEDTTFSSNMGDLIEAANFMEKEFEGPKILIGHSLGGTAVLLSANQIPSSTCVVTINAPYNPDYVTKLLGVEIEDLGPDGEKYVWVGDREFKIKKKFLESLKQGELKERIGSIRKSLLILHSPFDDVVGIDHATQIFQAAKHPKSYISLDRTDHLLTEEKDARYVGAVIAHWASRYV